MMIENEPLAKYSSWRIGGPARFFANAASRDELREALSWAYGRDLPVCVLGGGTNLLVRDAGFAGLVLRYRAQELRVEPQGDRASAWCAAGAPMAGTARRLAAQGWAGLQWAEGLPGTVGGAVFGNAGCYGGDIASVLARAWLLVDGEVEEWTVERFAYGYRTSALKRPTTNDQRPTSIEDRGLKIEDSNVGGDKMQSSILYSLSPAQGSFVVRRWSLVGPIVIAAEFALTRADPRALAEQMERTAAERRSKTPWGSSCGSVFKNPPGESAGRLIEAAGLKGTRVGGAEIAQKHANYIVNLGGATSDDVLRLIEIARERVASEFGIALELEVQIVG